MVAKGLNALKHVQNEQDSPTRIEMPMKKEEIFPKEMRRDLSKINPTREALFTTYYKI